MSINIYEESLITLTEAHKHLPKSPSWELLIRWRDLGVQDKAGQFVYLEVVKIGGRLHTSLEAFDRFIEAVNKEVE